MTTNRKVALSALAGTAMWVSGAASAQIADPAGATPQTSANSTTAPAQAATTPQAQNSDLPDIIVTATKIETRLQDTPIAIRVVGGADLTKAGVTDVAGLQRLAPDLGITPDSVFTKIAIRGVSSQDISESADPALTVSIDGEYVNRPVALNASFFDLERIEVLRGPQGTLFGRNSTAGALNIVAAKPVLGVTEGSGTVGYGNYDAIYATGAINLPVGDTIAVRIAGLHNQHDGYVDNGPAGKGDDANVDAVRGSVLFAPGALQVYLAGEYVDVDQTGPVQYGLSVNGNTPGVTELSSSEASPVTYPVLSQRQVPSGVDLPAGFDRSAFDLPRRGSFKSQQYAVRGRVSYDFGGATLSYIGGYRHVNNQVVLPQNGFVPEVFTFYNDRYDTRTQSHEVRLNGGEQGAFVWQVGGFYFYENQIIARGLYLPQARAFANFFYRPYVKSESKSAFAQGTYWLVPDELSFTGGIRYTDDKKDAKYINYGFYSSPTMARPPADGSGAGAVIRFPTYTEDKITWTAGVEYKPAQDNLLYAKVSTGYKSGGFDLVGSFSAENLTAYEIGSKNRFFDNMVEFNASAFYYDYKDQQVQVYIDTTVGARTFNAGKSRVWGIETDTSVRLSPNDRVSLIVNYIDAKLQEFSGIPAPTLTNPPANVERLTLDLAGNTAPQAPKWTIGLNYTKTVELGGGYQLVANGFSRFKSKYYLTAFNYAGDEVKAFTTTDLSLEFKLPGNRISLQGYVRNVENNRVKTYAGFTGGGINIYNWNFGQPRTFGAQGTFRF
ncbi:TonB-dependent receptor [Sphingomonas prati]|uniref:Iron complex outermembrane receptor protein n=1 Tax=Sphingomonas prati TaxID=1843237 RepID=A0A7W9F0A4_9SPHN|nr:TonB-dependent receptor [Sphingomonas prati]MBB5728028.1 iron complex outermembrane receptor protein [Sphingomonas prati]GGE82694.1 TonB-dependent receptor [Sphingomonas prati]